MASTNKTTNYELSQFVGNDIPAWLSDYNGDMSKIDAGIHAAKTQADGAANGVSVLNTAISGKQDKLTFDSTPLSGSSNPVTSDGIYNALQNAQIQTDAVPTAGSTKPIQSGGVYTALQGKQNTLVFDSSPAAGSNNPVISSGIYDTMRPGNQFGNFMIQKTSSSVIDDPKFRYFYNPVSRLFIGYPMGHNVTITGANWTVASDALFPSVQTLRFIDGNPFSLTPNNSFPVTQAQILSVIGASLATVTIKNTDLNDALCYIKMAYFTDINRTVIFAQANLPDANNHSVPATYISDCGYHN